MRLLTGGELVVNNLVDQGIRYVFSIIGGQMGTIYDAIGKRSNIEIITPRCETASALMACGYTASTGIPSVSMATVGAGVVYEVAGLIKAWFDYLPVISIAPQVQSWKVKPHQESLQACNQDELFYPITKWNTIIYHWDRIPQMIHRAFREAFVNIPGPVHIDVPVDILFKYKVLTERKKQRIMPHPCKSRYIGPIKGDMNLLKKASDAAARAQRPVVIVGQGIGRPGRYENIRKALNNMGMPVITTIPSSGIMCGSDKCYAGDITLYTSSKEGIEALKEADLLLIVGIDPYSREIVSLIKDSSQLKTIVQIEVDPSAFINTTNHITVHADPQSGLAFIANAIRDRSKFSSSWLNRFIDLGDNIAKTMSEEFRDTKVIFSIISAISTDNDIIIADGKDVCIAASYLLRKAIYKNLFIMDSRDISGAGLPFAIGTAIGNPDNRVTLICDKDSLFYHVRELQPAISMGLDFNIICIDEVNNATNVADTASVLEGLGCDVHRFDPKKDKDNDLLKHKTGIPGAVIFRPAEEDT